VGARYPRHIAARGRASHDCSDKAAAATQQQAQVHQTFDPHEHAPIPCSAHRPIGRYPGRTEVRNPPTCPLSGLLPIRIASNVRSVANNPDPNAWATKNPLPVGGEHM
jgi:hypothetical protein